MIPDDTLGPNTIQAVMNFTGTGDQTIISGIVGKFFKVLQMFFVVNGATTLVFKSGTVPISGPMAMLANGSLFMDYIHLQLEGLATGDSFVINSTGTVTLGGTIWYILAV